MCARAEVKIISSRSESLSQANLPHHDAGSEVGERFVLSDSVINPGGNLYMIARWIPAIPSGSEGFVRLHAHSMETYWVALGSGEGFEGLEIEVITSKGRQRVRSPATVCIPAGAPHAYRLVKGAGIFMNIVHGSRGDYRDSLAKAEEAADEVD